MNSDSNSQTWHGAIIAQAEAKLLRPLLSYEKDFITSRGGYISLEMIHDTVRSLEASELEDYLKSEWNPQRPSE